MPPTSNARHAHWNGVTTSVIARLVPRYAWTSASIDVSIEERVILRTGGVFRVVGKHCETFHSNGGDHAAELAWGKASLRSFPVILRIDGASIIDSRVPIQNWWLAFWPLALFAGFLVWCVLA